MTRFADTLISGGFATGDIHYKDFYPHEEHVARLVLIVTVARSTTVQAIVDTGAPWCIFAPDIVRDYVQADHALSVTLLVRGISYTGKLVRMRIGLRAECGGDDLDVDATVFVPKLPPGAAWPYPNFIGLDGFLNRIRFAVDPFDNIFYFGAV